MEQDRVPGVGIDAAFHAPKYMIKVGVIGEVLVEVSRPSCRRECIFIYQTRKTQTTMEDPPHAEHFLAYLQRIRVIFETFVVCRVSTEKVVN